MDRLREYLEDLAGQWKSQKLEFFLMFLFVIAAVGFGMDEISKEAEAVSDAVMEAESESETEQPESEAWTEEPWTEPETEEAAKLSAQEELEQLRRWDKRRLAALGPDFCIPMRMPEGYVPELYGEGEADGADNADNADNGEMEWHTLEDWYRLRGDGLVPLGDDKADNQMDGEELEAILAGEISSYDGEWSVYMKDLATDEEIVLNDRPMKSASVMKLFIMGTVYQAIETGELERTDEVMSLMNNMITYSANDDSNRLLYLLGDSNYARGIAQVNAFIQEHGFSKMTVEYNGFNDPATNTGTGNYNQVTARDCGRLLEAVYHREWVNRSVSNEIEQMMLNQNTRYKIPAGLPEGVFCGNKSGEMDTTENDAAVIYTDHGDYILVVLSSDWNSKDEAISRIQSISSQVYEYVEERADQREKDAD